jgi:large subunit ribosomal protein L4
VTDELDDNLWMSSRNLPHVLVVEARHIDPVSMVHFSNVLMTSNAVKMIEEMLG